MLDNPTIAKVLGVPVSRVQANWPLVDTCLASLCGPGYSDAVRIAALATIRVECPPFTPIHEYGSDELHEKLYGHRKDLGDVNDGDGAKYAGRGYIQITGEFNYKNYGDLLGVDLVHNPDAALEANTAAAIFAAYFHQRGCDKAANAHEWTKVRHLVNGGSNGLKAFLFYVQNLGFAAKEMTIYGTAAADLKLAAAASSTT